MLPELPASLPYDLRKEINWIDFSNPVNPLGTPKPLIQALHTALVDGELAFQPDRTGYALRRILAAYNEIPIESLLLGSSQTSLIRDTIQALEATRVGTTVPCTIDKELAVVNAGAEFVPLPNSFSFATCKYRTARHESGGFDTALLANPGFPTSRLLLEDVLVQYLENCDWVLVDETYVELSMGGESFIPLTKRYRNLVVIRSATATFAIPGSPLSYLVAHPDTIAQIMPYTDPNSISMTAEVLAQVFPQLMGYLDHSHDYLENEIPWLQYGLSLIPGIRIFPSEGNYILCSFKDDGLDLGVRSAYELSMRLQLSGMLVPQLSRISGLENQEDYFIVSAKGHDTNRRLLEKMRSIISH